MEDIDSVGQIAAPEQSPAATVQAIDTIAESSVSELITEEPVVEVNVRKPGIHIGRFVIDRAIASSHQHSKIPRQKVQHIPIFTDQRLLLKRVRI